MGRRVRGRGIRDRRRGTRAAIFRRVCGLAAVGAALALWAVRAGAPPAGAQGEGQREGTGSLTGQTASGAAALGEKLRADSLRADSLLAAWKAEMARQGLTPVQAEERLRQMKMGAAAPPQPAVVPTEAPAAAPAAESLLVAPTPVPPAAGLPMFGHEFFARAPATFVPPTAVPAGPNYVVGAGDEIIVRVWGKTELAYTLVVDREGNIALPEAGPLSVAGRTMANLEDLVARELRRFYTGIQVSVSTGRLRTLTVYVVGDVLRPGAYTVSSLATVFNALYAAGGPSPAGSLRRVKLMRRSGPVAVIDFYRYLLEGDNSTDVRVEEGDAVFVPPVGPTVTVAGEVRRPAVYELQGEETLGDLLVMAGGPRATAYLGRISIDRVSAGLERRLIDVEPSAAGEGIGLATPLRDGDRVTVFAILNDQVNRVELLGHVRLPGTYELREEMRVMDLLREGGGVRGDAYLPRADIARTNVDRTTVVVPFDLGKALMGDPSENRSLQPQDRVRVYSSQEALPFENVEIRGEVKLPGIYPLTADMTVADLIFLAGGLNESAYLEKAELARLRPQEGVEGGRTTDVIDVSLAAYSSGEAGGRLPLQPGDRVYIRRIPEWRPTESVELAGEVRFPGFYPILQKGERLSSVIERAGGVTRASHLPAVVFTREGEGRVMVDVERLLKKKDSREDILLQGGDRVTFPRTPETVKVTGAVYLPASIKFVPGKKASYYIEKCGGFLEEADAGQVRVVQANGMVERVRDWWSDPTVKAGATVEVPLKPEKVTDWGTVLKDSAQTLASLVTVIFFTREMANR